MAIKTAAEISGARDLSCQERRTGAFSAQRYSRIRQGRSAPRTGKCAPGLGNRIAGIVYQPETRNK